MKMAESTGTKSTSSTSTSDTNKEYESALEVQREAANKRAAEDELINATTEDGVIAAAARYEEV